MQTVEAVKVMVWLGAAYPRHDISEATVLGYSEFLLPLDYAAVMAAAKAHAKLSKWFPTIAELLELVGENEALPSVGEAWMQATEAVARGSRQGMHPLVADAFDAVLGLPNYADLSPWNRKVFIDVYRDLRDDADRRETKAWMEKLQLPEPDAPAQLPPSTELS